MSAVVRRSHRPIGAQGDHIGTVERQHSHRLREGTVIANRQTYLDLPGSKRTIRHVTAINKAIDTEVG